MILRALFGLCCFSIVFAACAVEEPLPEEQDMESLPIGCQIPVRGHALIDDCQQPPTWPPPPPPPPACEDVCTETSSCSTACTGDGSSCSSYGLCTNARRFTQVDNIKSGAKMTTTVKYKISTGVASGTTKLKNSDSAFGYTGGLMVAFVNEGGLPVHMSPLHQWGVNPCYFSCPRYRTESWSKTVPSALRDEVAGIAILQKHTPTYRFWMGTEDVLSTVNQVLDLAGIDNQITLILELVEQLAAIINDMSPADIEEDVEDMLDWIDEKTQWM
jgi:hypothetical protein